VHLDNDLSDCHGVRVVHIGIEISKAARREGLHVGQGKGIAHAHFEDSGDDG